MHVIARSLKNLQVEITTESHKIISDEPPGIGDGAGPTPYELLLAALGSCVVITLHMYAERKKWPLEKVEVTLDTYSIHAKDCEECESNPDARVSVIEKNLTYYGDLTPEQIERLTEISDRCPVSRTLKSEIVIRNKVTTRES